MTRVSTKRNTPGPANESWTTITAEVVRANVVAHGGQEVACYTRSSADGWELALDLSKYLGRRITLVGQLKGSILYRAELSPNRRLAAVS